MRKEGHDAKLEDVQSFVRMQRAMQRLWEAMGRRNAERFHEELKRRNDPVDLGATKAFVRVDEAPSALRRPRRRVDCKTSGYRRRFRPTERDSRLAR